MHGNFQSERRWKPRIALAPIALISIFGSTLTVRAATCDGQKGKVIFEDTFDDDSGGWESDSNAKIGGGTYTAHLQPERVIFNELNGTFNASEADYCVEVVMPPPIAPDNPVHVGIIFWATDYGNFYLVNLRPDGRSLLYRRMDQKWTRIADLTDPSVKPDVGSVVAIRVHAAGNLITPSINGVDLKKIRAQMPSGTLKFGFSFETAKENPPPGIDVSWKRFIVTSGK